MAVFFLKLRTQVCYCFGFSEDKKPEREREEAAKIEWNEKKLSAASLFVRAGRQNLQTTTLLIQTRKRKSCSNFVLIDERKRKQISAVCTELILNQRNNSMCFFLNKVTLVSFKCKNSFHVSKFCFFTKERRKY